jgi:hypothetical protein
LVIALTPEEVAVGFGRGPSLWKIDIFLNKHYFSVVNMNLENFDGHNCNQGETVAWAAPDAL